MFADPLHLPHKRKTDLQLFYIGIEGQEAEKVNTPSIRLKSLPILFSKSFVRTDWKRHPEWINAQRQPSITIWNDIDNQKSKTFFVNQLRPPRRLFKIKRELTNTKHVCEQLVGQNGLLRNRKSISFLKFSPALRLVYTFLTTVHAHNVKWKKTGNKLIFKMSHYKVVLSFKAAMTW